MKLRAAPSTEMPAIGVISEVKFTVEMIDLCETTSFVDQKFKNLEVIRLSKEYYEVNYLRFNKFTTRAHNTGVRCGDVN